jgi:hypothetical protein
MNNGNDGISGCSGYEPNSYYKTVASLGWHAAGGESEPAAEWNAIMANLIGMDYGGEWNCCTDLSNIWVHQMKGQKVSGKGMAAYLETYVGVCRVDLCPDAVVNAAVACKNAGCKEVGLMIGNWMINHGFNAQSYINIIQAMEAKGVTCAGVVLWAGYGADMNSVYNQNASIIKALQAVYPPNMTTLKNRFTGTPGKPTAQGISVSESDPMVNEPVTITAQLKAGNVNLANKPVKIWHYLNNVAYVDATKSTDNNGLVSVVQSFGSIGVRSYYAEFAGDATYLKSTSPKMDITVSPPVSVLNFKVDKTHPELNEEVTFTVKLSDIAGVPIKGKKITLSHKLVGTTYTDGVITTTDTGEATLKQKFGGSYCERPYFASFSGDTQYRASKAELTVYVTNKG